MEVGGDLYCVSFNRKTVSIMNNLCIRIWCSSILLFSLGAQHPEKSRVEAQVVFGDDSPFDWQARILVIEFPVPSELPFYEVRNELAVSGHASVLESPSGLKFVEGETIDSDSPEYLAGQGGDRTLALHAYQWTPPGIPPDFVFPLYDKFPGQREVIIGTKYRDPESGDVTFGWFRYRREDTGPTGSFALSDWTYNPIPNEPIRAGLPPDLPEPEVAVTEHGLQVSWPEPLWRFTLEWTASLAPPVQWTPVDAGGSTSVIVPFPEEGQGTLFFRLVSPVP